MTNIATASVRHVILMHGFRHGRIESANKGTNMCRVQWLAILTVFSMTMQRHNQLEPAVPECLKQTPTQDAAGSKQLPPQAKAMQRCGRRPRCLPNVTRERFWFLLRTAK